MTQAVGDVGSANPGNWKKLFAGHHRRVRLARQQRTAKRPPASTTCGSAEAPCSADPAPNGSRPSRRSPWQARRAARSACLSLEITKTAQRWRSAASATLALASRVRQSLTASSSIPQ